MSIGMARSGTLFLAACCIACFWSLPRVGRLLLSCWGEFDWCALDTNVGVGLNHMCAQLSCFTHVVKESGHTLV
jgi:hypothetical protein